MICGRVMLIGLKQPLQSWQQASRYDLMAGSSHMQAVPTPILAVVAHRSIHEDRACADLPDPHRSLHHSVRACDAHRYHRPVVCGSPYEYGALSCPQGQVAIQGKVDIYDGKELFCFTWTE